MCDTLVALGKATADGAVLFAKNSDREPNEAHMLVTQPPNRHAPGSKVRCTYLEIPQVSETYAVLLAKPFWMWGAEMGANEHGVTIGNEAIFTKVPYEKKGALTGMDLLRLGLERSSTALGALEVITTLLETYGQGGNCGYTHPFYYHNSFIIADPLEAWVLETAGKQWAAERVRGDTVAGGMRSISNLLTIGSHWDLASADLVNYALKRRWYRRGEDFNFARCYTDPLYTRLSDARSRHGRTCTLMGDRGARLDTADMMRFLRDHGSDATPDWTPGPRLTGADVCMHASFGPVRNSQSVGSMVSRLVPGGQTHWLTATSAPCTSTFKPVWLDSGLPETGPQPGGLADQDSLWWQHERLHRAVLRDYSNRLALFQEERQALEDKFVRAEIAYRRQNAGQRLAYTTLCFQHVHEAEETWRQRVVQTPVKSPPPKLFQIAWNRFNRQANLT